MIAAHPSVLEEQRREREETLSAIINKIQDQLTEDELLFLCWSCSFSLVGGKRVER